VLTPPALPAVVHATLSGYVAFALLHGAASPLRRRLGVAFLWFCLYSVTIGALYAIDAQLVAWSLNLACALQPYVSSDTAGIVKRKAGPLPPTFPPAL